MIRARLIVAIALSACLGGWIVALASEPLVPPLSDVPEFMAHDGVLSVTLEAKAAKTVFSGVTVDTLVYNGDFAGPVLRLSPGDTLRVRFRNRLDEPSNLHFHGFQGTPKGNSDNAHLSIPAGHNFDYELKIPKHQPPGAYWYHAHQHGLAEKQVSRGLSGAMMIEGFTRQIPALTGVRERLFALKSIEIEDSDDPIVNDEWHGIVQTVNGRTTVNENLGAGETALWHLTNHDANLTVHLSLEGHHFTIVGRDGAAIPHPIEADILHLPPAARLEVLVTGGQPGMHPLIAHNVLTGQGAGLRRDRVIGAVTVSGPPGTGRTVTLPPLPDLSQLRVTGQREFVYTSSKDVEHYYINNIVFDPHRIDTRVRLGDVEDWTIKNDTDDMHSFHIHQLAFQVMSINGKPEPFNGFLDTVRVPERGQLVIRLAFTQPEIVGNFMYHCHILKHEDRGMMQNIEVIAPPKEQHASRGAAAWLAALIRSQTQAVLDAPICGAG